MARPTDRPPVLPVLDLMHGCVVRGVAGRRETYLPLASKWCEGSRPREVARGLRAAYGFSTFYVADLDAIETGRANASLIGELIEDGFHLLLDAGVGNRPQQRRLAQQLADATVDPHPNAGAIDWVIGLESLTGADSLDELAGLLEQLGPERLIFSLDLIDGQPKTRSARWTGVSPQQIVAAVVELGLRRMIVLDLAAVGVAHGPVAADLCRTLSQRWSELSLISGGGVRNVADIQHLHDAGCQQVLVATGLHNGAIEPANLGNP